MISLSKWANQSESHSSGRELLAGQEADHQLGHVLVNRILIPLESVDQLLELLLPILATLPSRFQGRGYLVDVLDVLSD